MSDRAVYLVFSRTAGSMGRFIRAVTGNEYNHVSVAFEQNPQTLYSFARFHKDAPFFGGFVCESGLRYSLSEAKVKICRIPLDESQYRKATGIIDSMSSDSDTYIYNMLSALLSPFRKKIRIRCAFTCIEFAEYLLGSVNAPCGHDVSLFHSMYELERLFSDCVVYEGKYPVSPSDGWGNDLYDRKLGIINGTRMSVRSNARLLHRAFQSIL